MTENEFRIIRSEDEWPPLPEGLEYHVYPQLHAPYGFKIVRINGKPMWSVATEDDYRTSEASRLGIPKEDVKPKVLESCHQTGPKNCSGGCYDPHGTRTGSCLPAYYNGYYRCGCF